MVDDNMPPQGVSSPSDAAVASVSLSTATPFLCRVYFQTSLTLVSSQSCANAEQEDNRVPLAAANKGSKEGHLTSKDTSTEEEDKDFLKPELDKQ